MEHRQIFTAAIALLSGGLILAGCSSGNPRLESSGWDYGRPIVASSQSVFACQPASDVPICGADAVASVAQSGTSTAPAAAAPAAALGYNVYFAFDKSNLSPEGRQTIATAAQAAGSDGIVRMRLVGKADLAGTDPYNMALSERRADSVREALLADGMTSRRIDESWVGEREPPVPTANGTREARNRVVEISLH